MFWKNISDWLHSVPVWGGGGWWWWWSWYLINNFALRREGQDKWKIIYCVVDLRWLPPSALNKYKWEMIFIPLTLVKLRAYIPERRSDFRNADRLTELNRNSFLPFSIKMFYCLFVLLCQIKPSGLTSSGGGGWVPVTPYKMSHLIPGKILSPTVIWDQLDFRLSSAIFAWTTMFPWYLVAIR